MKKRQIIIYMVVLCLLFCTSVYATIGGKLGFSIKTENEAVYPGDELLVTVSLKELEAEGGLNAIEGYIDINKNIIEPLTIDSIVTENGKVTINEKNILNVYSADKANNVDEGIIFNTEPVSGKGDYRIVINLANKITTDTDLVTIKFRVKSDVAPGNYENAITYKTFKIFSEASNEKEELSSQAIRVVVSEKANDRNEVNNTNNNTNNNQSNNTNTNNVINQIKNNTTNNVKNNTVNNTQNVSKNLVNNNQVKNNTVNKNESVVGNDKNNTNNQTPSGTTQNKPDNTVANTDLPKTGYKLLLIPVIIIAIGGLVFYKKYSKYNKFN